MVLCISTKSYCFVQGSTVSGPLSGGVGLRQGNSVPRPVCVTWMQKAVDGGLGEASNVIEKVSLRRADLPGATWTL